MKFKFCLTKKRKIVTIYVFEEDGMEKRYESDMTRKEKRQNELKKLKSMTFKQKAAYIWEYYKGVFAGIIIACVIISIGVQMFQNSQLKSLLSIAVVDSNYNHDEQVEAFWLMQEPGTSMKWWMWTPLFFPEMIIMQ